MVSCTLAESFVGLASSEMSSTVRGESCEDGCLSEQGVLKSESGDV